MFTLALILALIGGFNPLIGQLSRDPGKYLLGAVLRFVGAFVFSLGYFYLGVPEMIGPFGGYLLPLGIMWLINGIVSVKDFDEHRIGGSTPGVLFALAAILAIVAWVGSWAMFNADHYYNMIGKVEEVSAESAREERIDMQHIITVSPKQAQFKFDKVLGEAQTIGSTFEVSFENGTIQDIDGRSYYVAPLDFSGIFRWNDQHGKGKGSPGWVIVDAHDPFSKAELVTGYNMVYTPGAFFGTDLRRHLWNKGYRNVGLRDFTFELKTLAEPYWVITMTKPTLRWSAEDVLGILVVDPQTGDVQEYKLDEVPAWIDRVYPDEIAWERMVWYGSYSQGWKYASFGGREGLFQPTDNTGADIWATWDADRRPFWWTGITSMNADRSNIGFMQFDMRTGQAYKHLGSGDTEDVVLNRIDREYEFKGWNANMAIRYPIYDQPSWVAPIVSGDGDFQLIGIAHAQHAIEAHGKTLQEALRNYQQALLTFSSATLSAEADFTWQTFVVSRTWTDVTEGSLTYYVYSADAGVEDLIFHGTGALSPELGGSKPGDRVRLAYLETGETLVSIQKFDNLDLPLITVDPAAENPKPAAEGDSN